MIFNLKERPFEAIKKGTKRIEIRPNKPKLQTLKVGDTITFCKEGSQEIIRCTVKRIAKYPTVRALLEQEGTQYTLSSTNDLEQGILSIDSIADYKELIEQYGVLALELSDVRVLHR